LTHPGVAKLRDALAAPSWEQLLGTLAGYAPAERPGEVLSLTRALPWWHYRAPKKP
jgi:putative molybdopterin biosynthesis protein